MIVGNLIDKILKITPKKLGMSKLCSGMKRTTKKGSSLYVNYVSHTNASIEISQLTNHLNNKKIRVKRTVFG